MNSSLLVPALIVVAVTAGIFVFGDSLFSGGSSPDADKYAVNQPKAKDTAAVAKVKTSASTGSDFSWEDDFEEPAQSPVNKPDESFVSTTQSEDAPGALYGPDNDSQVDESFDSADDFADTNFGASDDFGASDNSNIAGVDDIETASDIPTADLQTASKQVDEKQVADDMRDFFSKAPQPTDTDASTEVSSVRQSEQAPSAPTAKAVDPSEFDVAMASPKSSDQTADAFGAFDSEPSDFTPAPSTKVKDDMKSVVAPEAKKTAQESSDVALSADAGGEISGDLEPVKSSIDQSVFAGAKSSASVKTTARKFKITNPKETTLAVTMNVDGKQVTLKPDQSYVIQDSDGDVEVTFSRGGSFGFETKTLKEGFYRFTVSREAGWQLVN